MARQRIWDGSVNPRWKCRAGRIRSPRAAIMAQEAIPDAQDGPLVGGRRGQGSWRGRGADPTRSAGLRRFGACIVMDIEQAENLSEIGIAKRFCYLFFLHLSLGHRKSHGLEKIVILGKLDPIDRQENHRGGKRSALVAIGKRVIACQVPKQYCRQVKNISTCIIEMILHGHDS